MLNRNVNLPMRIIRPLAAALSSVLAVGMVYVSYIRISLLFYRFEGENSDIFNKYWSEAYSSMFYPWGLCEIAGTLMLVALSCVMWWHVFRPVNDCRRHATLEP